MLEDKPINVAPTNPKGETSNNSLNFKRLGLEKFGASVIDSRMGSSAKDKSIETKINKSTFRGSLRFNKNWPKATKEKVMII